jgi:ribonuclease P protein component
VEPGVVVMVETLRRRSEFLRVRGGDRWGTAAFVLEGKPRTDPSGGSGPRFGFTVSRQMGNAVVRNRMRRRLREVVRLSSPLHARPDFDYVLIGRAPAIDRAFVDLQQDLETAFARVHRPPRGKSRAPET